MKWEYSDFFYIELQKLLNIDSVSGDFESIQKYLVDKANQFKYSINILNKGGILIDLGGEKEEVVINAHADTLGLMVKRINDDGTLEVTNIGRLPEYAVENSNVVLYTILGKKYSGTIRRKWSCVHVTPMELRNEPASYTDNLILQLDEAVSSIKDVIDLGIDCGDIVSLDPKTVFTNNGYIKSYFLDDKINVALLITLMKYNYDKKQTQGYCFSRKVYIFISMHEEVMHGGAVGIPKCTKEMISVDVSCVCQGQNSDEHSVSICMADSRFPYNREIIKKMTIIAKENNIDYKKDIFIPTYGTDADIALLAGFDIKHALIGPGIVGTHGYERTHMDSVKQTFNLLVKYLEMEV